MGVFTRNIVVEYNPENELPYRIFRPFEFHLGKKNSGTFVRCDEGFEFNGTSMPWGTRWLISPGDLELLQCAGGHDKVFCDGALIVVIGGREYKHRVSRKAANRLMAEMMKARNVALWKRCVINTGLQVGSGPRWSELRALDMTEAGE